MSEDIKLEDVRLQLTEDPLKQKMEVLRTASLDVRTKNAGGRIAMIAKVIDKDLTRLQRRHRWAAHEMVLAQDYLLEAYCVTIYNKAVELEAQELLTEPEGDPTNDAAK